MAKQNEWQRSGDPRDTGIGDEERIRGVEDTGIPEDAEDEDFDDTEDVDDDEDEEASF